MSNGEVATRPGRLLLADGDGLAYYCAGNDETAPGEARMNLVNKLRSAARASGSERVRILSTASDSHKGYRFAVAREKPYQGQRKSNRRPRQWQFLRDLMADEAISEFEYEATSIAEADDLFGKHSAINPDCVIYTQDKDMQMVPGWHLDWLTHLIHEVPADTWCKEWSGKVWGRKWFWLQMLHGDSTDNIPGLPRYNDNGKLKLIGPSTAGAFLADCPDETKAAAIVGRLYYGLKPDRWVAEMLEQGILLWMRNDAQSSPLNVCAPGNPLHALRLQPSWITAKAEVMARITESLVHDETEGVGDSERPRGVPVEEQPPVCPVQVASVIAEGGAGPRPLDRGDPRHAAQRVQLPAGQGGEQLPPLRRAESTGIPSWGARLLAKA